MGGFQGLHPSFGQTLPQKNKVETPRRHPVSAFYCQHTGKCTYVCVLPVCTCTHPTKIYKLLGLWENSSVVKSGVVEEPRMLFIPTSSTLGT